jgi:Neuraminidase (sialidase)
MNRSRIVFLTTAILVIALAGQAIAATLMSDTQANQPQVAGDATSNTTARFPTNKQNEPTVAIAPDGTHALAGSNDEQKQPACGTGTQRGTVPGSDCSFFPGVGTSAIYTSSNGGSTWANQGLLPGYTDTGSSVAASAGRLRTSAAQGTLVSDGDPVIVYGPKPTGAGGFSFATGARAYYANLSSFASGAAKGNQAPELLAVSISDDNGASWYDPIVAARSNGHIFNDKEAIWADRTDGSPNFGRVYVSWTQFRDIPGCAEPVMFAYSADGGLTWSRPNQLSSAHNCGIGGRQGSAIRSGPDGNVLVFWEDSDQLGSKQVVQISHDGGLTFSKSITVGRVTDIQDPIPGANFRTDSFLSAAVAPSGAVYAAWSTRTTAGGRIVVAKSTTGGTSWLAPVTVSRAEGYAFFQGLDVAPNGRVDVGYQAQVAIDPTTYGTGNATVNSYYVSSGDGGATWSSPTLISTAGSDPAASAQNNLARQFWGDYNTLASANGFALFIYTDSRTGVGCAAVDTYQHALDAGTTATKPAPPTDCASQFGNSDVFVSKVAP